MQVIMQVTRRRSPLLRAVDRSSYLQTVHPFRTPSLRFSSSSPSVPTSTSLSHTPTTPISSKSTSTSTVTPTTSSRVNAYLPRLKALSARTGVPLPSLAISFLILHELTAFVPLLFLFFIFQAFGAGAGFVEWIASSTSQQQDLKKSSNTNNTNPNVNESEESSKTLEWRDWMKSWYEEGAKRAESLGRRYGIWGFEKGSKKNDEIVSVEQLGQDAKTSQAAAAVADAISAYIVVKALFPIRIGLSIAAAPSFARFTLLPIHRFISRFFRS